MKAGDVIECINGDKLKIVSAEGFNLVNEHEKAEYILIDERTGGMEGYSWSMDQIAEDYHIYKVHTNDPA
ncbi:hypothetical protein [Halobacillus karajensis]|uniref:Uncharacterized protein n=1 Tax=Halobacillus karajensis TaxID=195088 RepID=A0A059NUY9_9BACI|nr:hypothetical protein [Halobacillus karajensis]CDQ22629.1 hypothetical protein BN983_00842 [Halobacillus karajensis]CDQ26111.1 hypothetical protein BN981_00322 [Halobacillus karajensis]